MNKLLSALAALLVSVVVSSAALAAVNLNTASKDELVALPGIGPAKAQAIIDYRTTHGPFKAVEDVRKVKGIGEKLFLQIKPELAVSGSAKVAAAAPIAGKQEVKPTARAEAGKNAK
jgi:competence protein ComEA